MGDLPERVLRTVVAWLALSYLAHWASTVARVRILPRFARKFVRGIRNSKVNALLHPLALLILFESSRSIDTLVKVWFALALLEVLLGPDHQWVLWVRAKRRLRKVRRLVYGAPAPLRRPTRGRR